MAKKIGRRKGSRNKGFFYRAGRGWVIKTDGKFVPLVHQGERLRDRTIDPAILEEAYAKHVLTKKEVPEGAGPDALVGEVCGAYLSELRNSFEKLGRRGEGKTYVDRGQTLFDFCYGLPGEFFCDGDKERRKLKGEGKKLHSGFGQKFCSELTRQDIDIWVNAHSWKDGGKRTRVQAVKRAFNYGVEKGLIAASPIRGYKIPRAIPRVTYLTPQQEKAMVETASPAFAIALQVCIRTGARAGCEFARLTGRNVRDHGDKMEWYFKPEDSKTGKRTRQPRIIRITDPVILQFVRDRMNDGAIFRNEEGEPWSREMLSQNFRRAKARVEKKGIQLDSDACMYSCRHTYAKRTLEGYWTGKVVSLHTLSRLMGNSVKVCIDHYLQFSQADNEMLWGAA